MIFVLGILGAKALYLTYLWLLSAITASWLSNRKGYGPKPGLASGLLLTFVGVIIWLVYPAKQASKWKLQGPIPRRGGTTTVAKARAHGVEGDQPKR